MSPIANLPVRIHEVGRIRLGEKLPAKDKDGNPTTRPAALKGELRLTSSDERLLKALGGIFGGIPVPWADAPAAGQFELRIEETELDILVPPQDMSLSQWYEDWVQGGCKRRCDGITELISGDACRCNPDERQCKPHTRISVMLADLVTTGLWRVESHGWYAAIEMRGAFRLAEIIHSATGRDLLPARLRVEHRSIKRPGEPPKNFVVPIIDFDLPLEQFGGGRQALPAGETSATNGHSPDRQAIPSSTGGERAPQSQPKAPARKAQDSTKKASGAKKAPTGLTQCDFCESFVRNMEEHLAIRHSNPSDEQVAAAEAAGVRASGPLPATESSASDAPAEAASGSEVVSAQLPALRATWDALAPDIQANVAVAIRRASLPVLVDWPKATDDELAAVADLIKLEMEEPF